MRHKRTVSQEEKQFDIYKSVWAGRAAFNDSNDVYDTEVSMQRLKPSSSHALKERRSLRHTPRSPYAPRVALISPTFESLHSKEVEMRRFANDWAQMCTELKLANFVMRNDDQGDIDLDGDGVPDELQEVEAVLWEFHDMIFILFMYYASLGSHDPNATVVEYPQWLKFLDDFKLYKKGSRLNNKDALIRIFMQVDSLSAAASKADPKRKEQGFHDDKIKSLSRQEFIATLVMIASNKFLVSGIMKDMSEALHRFLAEDILPHVDPSIFQVANVFRTDCYSEDATRELARHERSLRRIFIGLNRGQRGKEAQLLCLEEWKAFVLGLGFKGADLSARDAALCFIFSRCAVVDSRNAAGELREINLPFEGCVDAAASLVQAAGVEWPRFRDFSAIPRPLDGITFLTVPAPLLPMHFVC